MEDGESIWTPCLKPIQKEIHSCSKASVELLSRRWPAQEWLKTWTRTLTMALKRVRPIIGDFNQQSIRVRQQLLSSEPRRSQSSGDG